MAFEDIESVVAAAAAASDGAPAPFCDTYDNDLDGGLVNPSDLHITAPASPAYTTSSTSSPRGVKREYDEEDEEDDDDISNADKSTTSAVTPKKKTLRKRAKTQEEKEQRAHERIMRNRLAAQTSRERKREYVTQLESQNTELERDIKRLTKDNDQLRGTVTDLNKRLSQLEKLLAVLTPATDSTASSSLGKSTAIATTSLSTEPIGLRSPAVTASDPQRRSVSSRRKVSKHNSSRSYQSRSNCFPWSISPHSPIYRAMEQVLQLLLASSMMTTYSATALWTGALATISTLPTSTTTSSRKRTLTCPQLHSSPLLQHSTTLQPHSPRQHLPVNLSRPSQQTVSTSISTNTTLDDLQASLQPSEPIDPVTGASSLATDGSVVARRPTGLQQDQFQSSVYTLAGRDSVSGGVTRPIRSTRHIHALDKWMI